MSESQTPRTNAIAFWYRPYSEHATDEEWCQADFARQLETELTAARARLAELEGIAERLYQLSILSDERLDQCEYDAATAAYEAYKEGKK